MIQEITDINKLNKILFEYGEKMSEYLSKNYDIKYTPSDKFIELPFPDSCIYKTMTQFDNVMIQHHEKHNNISAVNQMIYNISCYYFDIKMQRGKLKLLEATNKTEKEIDDLIDIFVG